MTIIELDQYQAKAIDFSNGYYGIPGVYWLVTDGLVAYVGASYHIGRRFAQHKRNGQFVNNTTRLFYIIEGNSRERFALEKVLIRVFAPWGNKQ